MRQLLSALVVMSAVMWGTAASAQDQARDFSPDSARVYRASDGESLAPPSGGSAFDVVTGFLRGRGQSDATANSLVVESSSTDSRSGVTHTRLRQQVAGMTVYGTYVRASATADGRLVRVAENLEPITPAALVLAQITQAEALVAVLAEWYPTFTETLPEISTVGNTTEFDGGSFFFKNPTVTRVVVPMANGALHGGYLVTTWDDDDNMLRHTVVGRTGNILAVQVRTSADSYRIFEVNPDDPAGALAARGESRSYEGSTQSIRRTTLTRMAMGTRETDQPPLWIATSDLPPSPGHPFYARLTTLLDGHHFDRFVEGLCARFYAPVMGRPSLAPGRYFRLLLVGSFEGIDSERGMAWRATDSLAVRSFLRLAVDEAPPDHSTIARTRRLIDLETHRTVFTWVQQRLVEAGRLTGKTIAIDATTLEANAAMRSIVRRDTGESSQAFLAGLATASGIETPTREALARLDRKRKKKTSNTDWTHPHDPDAKVTKMKDGRTHLAHKAEHAVDMETGAIVAVTLHGADVGDTTTIIETAIAATEQVEDAQANVDDPQALDEIVGDKGYHSNQTLIDLDAVGIRSYVSEPDRGRRDWSKAPEAQAPVYGNRRRMRGRRGRRLMRQRGERIERSFAHLYDTGGMRRTHLRGHTNILKRLLIHAGGFNLGLVMRHLIGIGTPRGLQGRVAAVRATLSVHMGVVRGRLTPISSSHRLIPAVRGRLASLTTFAVNSSAAITCTTG